MQKKKPIKRAFTNSDGKPALAGSPLAKVPKVKKPKEEPEPVEVIDGKTGLVISAPDPIPAAAKKRGRPHSNLTPAERKARQRATKVAKLAEKQRQGMIAETVQQQRIDDKTYGRGAGLNMPEAPHGRGRIETGGIGAIELDVADARDQQNGRNVAPEGTVPDGPRARFHIPDTFNKSERAWREKRRVDSSIEVQHYCRYCPKPRPAFKQDVDGGSGIFKHIQEKHPEKQIPELGIVSIFSCRTCRKKLKTYAEASEHVSIWRRKHKRRPKGILRH